jgi:hypothetical protein
MAGCPQASASVQRDWPVLALLPTHRSAATCRVGGCYPMTRSSWLREVMPSLVKTLLRWYWTVRALM